MSEYWVSRKKYFCTYCEIYIADDAPSRRQHENGLRHQGNKARFVRGLYKQGERRKKDLEEEKLEIARIDQAANAAYARDLSQGNASIASSSKSIITTTRASGSTSAKISKPTSAFENYSTAQSLGYTDPDVERIQKEIESRRSRGVVGEWQTVVPPPPPLPNGSQEISEHDGKIFLSTKHSLESDDAFDDRQYRVRQKVIAVGSDIWNPDSIPIKLKADRVKEEVKIGAQDEQDPLHEQKTAHTETIGKINGTVTPKWASIGWKKNNSNIEPTQSSEQNVDHGQQPAAQHFKVKEESITETLSTSPNLEGDRYSGEEKQPLDISTNASPIMKPEVAEKIDSTALERSSVTTSKNLFRKRKIQSGNREPVKGEPV